MIKAVNISKSFGKIKALDSISAEIKQGSVFGLVGTNGAGKSTFLRVLAGIYQPDTGAVTIEDQAVFENPALKERCFYISDEQYFFNNCNPLDILCYYQKIFPAFNKERYLHLLKNFELDPKRKVNTFSKGMKKQVSVIAAISSGTDYIFCDETFDGLDPVIRQAVKSLFAADVAERNLTPIIASHNLRELEDICDHIGLLHKGGILFTRDLDDMKLDIHKIQAIFSAEKSREDFAPLEMLSFDKRGSLYTIIARGEKTSIEAVINAQKPVFSELLPLTLEEIFISETEVKGYDIKKLLEE